MPRYVAIEGLRGWLAWTVVAAHIVLFAGFDAWHPVGWFIAQAGFWAVAVFVMISGFVISHLLIEKSEPYGAYIVRRLMRLLPAFLVASVLGAGAVTWAAVAAAHSPLSAIPGYGFAAQVVRWQRGWFAHVPSNIALHLSMLHGLSPSSEYAFLPPGWSVSLEWQYYLIAPLLLVAVKRGATWTTAAALLVAAAWNATLGQVFASPSALPAMGYYFVIGALSRVWLRPTKLPAALALLSLGLPFVLRSFDLLPLGVWGAFLVFLVSERAAPGQKPGWVALALESPVARYVGERSYSVYLLHFPILWALFALTAPYLHSRGQLAACLALAAPPLIMAAADLSYRLVERPGMALGRRLARGLMRSPPAKVEEAAA